MKHVTSSQKNGHRIATNMMGPAFLLNLTHTGINPWKSCLSILPFVKQNLIPFPRDLESHRVSLNLKVEVVFMRLLVKEFTPEELFRCISKSFITFVSLGKESEFIGFKSKPRKRTYLLIIESKFCVATFSKI